MTLSELRLAVLDYLDANVETDVFVNTAQLDRFVNIAYVSVVNKVEFAAPYFNVSGTVLVLTTPSAAVAREYAMNASPFAPTSVTDIRKIADCARLVDDVPYLLRIVPFAKRNGWLGRPGGRLNPVPLTAVYFYRTAIAGDLWYFGFVNPNPPSATQFEVRYLPKIVSLSGDSAVPHYVPEAWHYLIALKAAIITKGKERRDAANLLTLYVEGLGDMHRELTEINSLPQVQVI